MTPNLRSTATAGLLAGKVVLVTGAASGIGAAAARAAAHEGAKVVLADRNAPGVEEIATHLAKSGAEVLAVTVDVSDAQSVAAMVASVAKAFGRLDAAFNNAGIGTLETRAVGNRAGDLEEDSWRRMLDVNLTGVWLCMKHEIAVMARGAAIVNMASIAGLIGLPRAAHYTAAKHGVVGLTKAAAIDYADLGIRINAICPGFVETPLTATSKAEKRAASVAKTPIGRYATAEEIAAQAIWLMSDRSGYVTGAAIAVDGGYTAA
ncbi:SDR family NAD(P)-dependent oxidoreductase [Seohaeicola nanhaiensis]|uniref:SDR family NAD(P)-dependent oxidoreductase n=1 Tax=Seohaeicola nanhaiensis TaxID=1387282 RepID=A0ABV9KM35_9RHOB